MTQYLGRADIAYDGKKVGSMPGATLEIGGVERKVVLLADGTTGYTEVPKASELECEVPVSATTPLTELESIVNATITFRCDTGQTYMIRGAFRSNTNKLTAKEGGNVKLIFNGPKAEPV